MFNTAHILYMIISALLSIGILVLCHVKAKKEKTRSYILRFFAVITIILHFSSLWVDFFKTGEAIVQPSMLLPIYPCNICMWLLLITAFLKNKENPIFRILAEFTFWAGTVCGSIGIIFNENYASTPTLADYDILKGLLSHSTMLIGCIYLFVGGFIKIRVSNVCSVFFGLCLFIIDGVVINTLYSVFGLSECNSMYLIAPPFPSLPWFNTMLIGIIGILACFTATVIYEQIFLKEEERWYFGLKQKISAINNKRS